MRILRTTARSPSALRTHSLVSFFIKNLALVHDFSQEPIPFLQPPTHVFRGPHNDIHAKRGIKKFFDANRLVNFIPRRHYY